jgi:superfamily I DNA/RNA helicase
MQDLMQNRPSRHPDFFGMRSWQDLKRFAATDEGRAIQGLVMLVQKMGIGSIFQAIDAVDSFEDRHTITLSTLHKAKGREWDSVELLDDFKLPDGKSVLQAPEKAAEEMRINYVALTRARHTVKFPDNLGMWLYHQRLG